MLRIATLKHKCSQYSYGSSEAFGLTSHFQPCNSLFQFYREKLVFALKLKCSNLKTTMNFGSQHIPPIIWKLVEFKTAEINVPVTLFFTSPLESLALL